MIDSSPKAKAFHDPVATRLGYLLRRASGVLMADLGASLVSINLRPVEATILNLIRANPDCTQSDLGRALGIQRANMVPLIAGLSARGLIAKSPVDGRSHALSLTVAGEKALDAAEALIAEHEARIEQLFAGNDTAGLKRVLGRIASNGLN